MLNLSGEMLITLLVVSVLTEILVEILKTGFPVISKMEHVFEVSIVLSVLLCVVFDVNMFNVAKENFFVHYASVILTGLVVSRGSNFIHDAFDRLKGIQKNA